MNAQEFANANRNVIVRYASQGAPAGEDIALLNETELPFDLEQIEGEVDQNGTFTATSLNDGHRDARGWKFHDWNRNAIYGLWLRADEDVWQQQYSDYMQACD